MPTLLGLTVTFPLKINIAGTFYLYGGAIQKGGAGIFTANKNIWSAICAQLVVQPSNRTVALWCN